MISDNRRIGQRKREPDRHRERGVSPIASATTTTMITTTTTTKTESLAREVTETTTESTEKRQTEREIGHFVPRHRV